MKGLTPKQQQILAFVCSFIEEHRYSPSYREIMAHFTFTSPGSVYKYIQILKKKGALVGDKHSRRSIMPAEKTPVLKESTDVFLPLIGNLTVGYPLELFAKHQMLPVPASLVHSPDDTYILQVQGDSLREEAIVSGDFVLIEARQDCRAGEIILGLIHQHDTVLKRYFPEGQYVRLESHRSPSSSMTIRHDHILIRGVLAGLLRLY